MFYSIYLPNTSSDHINSELALVSHCGHTWSTHDVLPCSVLDHTPPQEVWSTHDRPMMFIHALYWTIHHHRKSEAHMIDPWCSSMLCTGPYTTTGSLKHTWSTHDVHPCSVLDHTPPQEVWSTHDRPMMFIRALCWTIHHHRKPEAHMIDPWCSSMLCAGLYTTTGSLKHTWSTHDVLPCSVLDHTPPQEVWSAHDRPMMFFHALCWTMHHHRKSEAHLSSTSKKTPVTANPLLILTDHALVNSWCFEQEAVVTGE